MHPEAYQFVETAVDGHSFPDVLEMGSLDINGSVRPLFAGAAFHGIDIVDGPGVDEVADAATWRSHRRFDCVVCCEVFEHTAAWRDLIVTALLHLHEGGLLLVTCAGPPRAPHSAVDGGQIRDGEWYENLTPLDLEVQLKVFASCGVEHHDVHGDTYGWAIK